MMDEPQMDQAAIAAKLNRQSWQNRYESGATGWDRGEPNPMLFRWLKEGLAPCRILVPGCGRGYEVLELAAQGFDVTAVDYAQSPVLELSNVLAQRGLVADVRRENILEYQTSQKFEAIYEQTSLCAIAPKHWEEYEQVMAEALKPGGKLYALFMQSGRSHAPPFSCDLAVMRGLFDSHRWEWSENQFTVDHPSGLKEIAVVLKRQKAR